MRIAFRLTNDDNYIHTGDKSQVHQYAQDAPKGKNRWWGIGKYYTELDNFRIVDHETDKQLTEIENAYRQLRDVANDLETEKSRILAKRFDTLQPLELNDL